VNLASGLAYVDGQTDLRGSGGRCGRGRTTCADRARVKGEGVARRVSYGWRPSHNRT